MENNKEKINVKILIIGAGPAGLSAAIYTARAGFETVVITGSAMGGQASLTAEIENYPGFPEVLSGAELMAKFDEQAEKFGAKLEYDSVTKVDFSSRPYKIETDGKIWLADNVIIASGSNHMLLNVPGEKEFTGKGVSYCATCDGFFYRGKKVAVVGGGNSAVEEAIFLTRFASEVYIIHRREALRADAIIQKRAEENKKIHFIWSSVVTEVLGNEKLTGLKIKNLKTGEEQIEPFDGVFVFIGFKTVTDIYDGQLEIVNGTIAVNKMMETSKPGIYAAGESIDSIYRQVITSAGTGAQAGIALTHALL